MHINLSNSFGYFCRHFHPLKKDENIFFEKKILISLKIDQKLGIFSKIVKKRPIF